MDLRKVPTSNFAVLHLNLLEQPSSVPSIALNTSGEQYHRMRGAPASRVPIIMKGAKATYSRLLRRPVKIHTSAWIGMMLITKLYPPQLATMYQ